MAALTALASAPNDAADAQLDWLLAAIRNNRFLPEPPAEKGCIGDGDHRAIGAEFLGYFARNAGLGRGERVLDLGCGLGRMAVPLTQYLEPCASYDGIDVAADAVAWCRETIGTRYERFRFHHLDCRHPLYNPSGGIETEEASLPFAEASFDFVFLTSVATHLMPDEMARYAIEIRRVLAPGGRCFVTAFLVNAPVRAALVAGRGDPRLPFDPTAPGPVFFAQPDVPAAAVAYDEDSFLATFLAAGLRRRRPAVYGSWSGRAGGGPSFQDICVLDIDLR
jgi:SAM-dependent methyltransferase